LKLEILLTLNPLASIWVTTSGPEEIISSMPLATKNKPNKFWLASKTCANRSARRALRLSLSP